ncbi:hypothetical protein [Archangium violaceum]|uniref:Uncharacterized protein n=1 Tax=Archangium violaceum Cb vi76 TaxID=1406225 RepID=A0A084STA1_9BACT|nr:hypothetical protein [Archangium violaceum]KFA91686.1 hypothetical protein Q664_20320 [Archangium violaceum Cb vi76]
MDLFVMEENVTGGLADLAAMVDLPTTLDVYEMSLRDTYASRGLEIHRGAALEGAAPRETTPSADYFAISSSRPRPHTP